MDRGRCPKCHKSFDDCPHSWAEAEAAKARNLRLSTFDKLIKPDEGITGAMLRELIKKGVL